MPKGKLVGSLGIGAVVAVVGLFGRAWWREHTLEQVKSDRIAQLNQFTADTLPGPYLKEGNPSELRVSVVDIQSAPPVAVSDQGDVLFELTKARDRGTKGAKKPSARPPEKFYRVCRRDGTIRDYLTASRMFMTPSGVLVRVEPTSSGYQVFSNDTLIAKADDPLAFDYDDVTLPFDDGLILNVDRSQVSRILPNHTIERTSLPRGTLLGGWDSSKNLGTFALVTPQNLLRYLFPRNELAHLANHSIEFLSLPDDCVRPSLLCCRDTVYVSTDGLYAPSRIYALRNGQFVVQAVPNDAQAVGLMAANSRGDLVVSATRGRSTEQRLLIRDGKWYLLDPLLAQVSIRNSPVSRGGAQNALAQAVPLNSLANQAPKSGTGTFGIRQYLVKRLTEDGSIVVLSNSHTYLMKVTTSS